MTLIIPPIGSAEITGGRERISYRNNRMVLINPLNISTDVKIAALLTLFFLTTLFLFLVSFKQKQRNEEQVLPLPPGLHGVPILGSLPFLNSNLHHYFADLARTYGPDLSLRLGSKLFVVISSPSTAREIFKDQDAAIENHVVPAAALFYHRSSNLDMLSAPYGTHWRMLRKIVVREMLSTASVEAVAPLRCREMRRTVKAVWNRAKMGATVGVRETAFLTTLNMMTNMLWGDEVAGSGEARDFRQVIEGIIDLFLAPNVADFFPVVAPLDPQGLGRRMGKLMDWITKYLDEIVEKKRQKMGSGERRRDVLEALLGLVETGNPQEPFAMDDLFKLIILMAELLNDPKMMLIAQQELDATVGKDRAVEESGIPQLHYLCAVVKESLRLHPSAPLLIPHCPSSRCTVGGFSVPAGTTVLVNVWKIQRDRDIWGEDAEEFQPVRFLNSRQEESDFHPAGNEEFCYLPFGAGRRVCVGTAMAEKMVIYMLASLLHSFDWRLPEGAPPLELGEKFGTVLRKAEELLAVPAVRLDKQELYIAGDHF